MQRNFSILILLLVTICSSQAAIDFTPMVEEYSSQGFIYRKVLLKEDKGAITFLPPQGWKVRGGKDLLQLEPPNKNFVEATISATLVSGPAPFDDARMEALKQQVLRSVPAASQSAQIVGCVLNPVLMGPHPSLEIVVSYTTLGRTFERSVLFVQTQDTQLVFRLSAPKEDFASQNQLFRGCVGSWQWINAPASSNTAVALK